MVQQGDTTFGYFDTLSLKDGKFEQYVQTTFSGLGERKLHTGGGALANMDDQVETQKHVTMRGEIHNGAPRSEWLFYTANFKQYSTCYSNLNWKRVNYDNPDTTFIDFWNGYDYDNKSGKMLGGVRQFNTDHQLLYSCKNGKCAIRESQGNRRIEVSTEEVKMTLERISLLGF